MRRTVGCGVVQGARAMTPRSLRTSSGALVPAELAARLTLVLAVLLVAFEVAIGALWTPMLRAFYVALTVVVAIATAFTRLSERVRGALVVVTWLASGWVGFFLVGLREGFTILTTSVALAGAFFGLRGGLAAIVATVLVASSAAWFHVGSVPFAPQRFVDSTHPDAWILQIGVFAALSFMMAVVQARHAAAVRASNERARSFAVVAERSTAAIVFTDLERRIVWVNEAFTALTGYGTEEVVGRKPGALLQGPGTDEADVARMREALMALRPCRVDVVNYRKGGAPYWVRIALQPYHDEDGVLRGFTGSQQDVSAELMAARFDEIERALLADFAGAESESLDAVLAQDLARSETVSWVRVWRRERRGLRSVALVQPESRWGLAALPAAAPEPREEMEGAVLLPAERDDAPTARIVAALGDGTDGLIELGVWRVMPGADAIVRRLPAILALHGLFVRRRADAQRLTEVFARSPESLVVLDREGKVSRVNDEALRLLPRLRAGTSLAECYPALAPAIAEGGDAEGSGASPAASASPQRQPTTYEVRDEAGVARALEVSVRRVAHADASDVLVAVRDLTERVRQLEATRESLAEKEVLLKEIHHRVKNNLQIISSMLNMQLGATTDPTAERVLRESALRVHAMALVHRSLYSHASLARVDFALYAVEIAELVRQSFAPEVQVDVAAEATEVSMDHAIPLGLVLNELLSNAFKYGLSPSERAPATPDIRVRWSREGDWYRLAVIDRGPGLPPGAGRKSLGLRLVDALRRQLRGTFENTLTEEGSVFTFRCPVTLEEGRD
jgi:PAS domain S-box-containing protein